MLFFPSIVSMFGSVSKNPIIAASSESSSADVTRYRMGASRSGSRNGGPRCLLGITVCEREGEEAGLV